jgi:hypothetical protein
MIERVVIAGRPGTMGTLDNGDIKIRFDDGEIVIATPDDDDETDPDLRDDA